MATAIARDSCCDTGWTSTNLALAAMIEQSLIEFEQFAHR
jgi:hypothetical protein